MSDFNTNRRFPNRRARRALQAGAIAAAIGGGYALRDVNVVAQGGAETTTPPARTAPVVKSAATQDAASMQDAFNQVSAAVEPAVVTIRNASSGDSPTSGRGQAPGNRAPRVRPFGQGQNAPGQGAPGADPFNGGDLQEFFKQFQRQFGFNEQNFNADNWQGRVLREKWADARARFAQDRGGRGGGLGSGMIYRADGLIITNAHVVRGATTVSVTLSDGRTFSKAKVLGRDDRTDIAVLKIDATNLPTVKLGDSDKTRSGDWAIAVGNPFGLDHTLTVGVISATKRNGGQLRLGGDDTRTDYLQTDASINPGNSGGPLLNINGLVVGVNNAIFSESGGNQGIGFAIPVNTARFVADRIVKDGRVRRSYLGVKISNLEGDLGAAFGIDPNLKGVLIQEISDTKAPGAKAGLQPGDVVTKINGTSVTTSSELQGLVGNAAIGSTATLTVVRDGRTLNLSAVLDELKDEAPARAAAPAAPAPDVTRGQTSVIPGLKLRNLTPEVARALGIPATTGVAVTEVTQGSPADEAGLQRGDVIERVASTAVSGVADFGTAVSSILNRQTGESKKVALYVNRAGQRSYAIVTIE